jgi:hypothetical protein
LKTTPTAPKTLRSLPPHWGQTVSESSVKACTMSNLWSHSVQA